MSQRVLFCLPGLHRVNRGAEVAFESIASELAREAAFEVTLLGKTATWILYASLVAILFTPAGTDWPLVLFWVGLGLSVLAGVDYVVKVLRVLR